jgi:hypothetical protein
MAASWKKIMKLLDNSRIGGRQAMTRQEHIARLSPEDFLYAIYPNGATRVCIVTSIDPVKLMARSITTQETFSFDRESGESSPAGDDGAVCKMVSVHLVPTDVRAHLEEIDRRYVASRDVDALRLSESERKALLDADSLFRSNPLPHL